MADGVLRPDQLRLGIGHTHLRAEDVYLRGYSRGISGASHVQVQLALLDCRAADVQQSLGQDQVVEGANHPQPDVLLHPRTVHAHTFRFQTGQLQRCPHFP